MYPITYLDWIKQMNVLLDEEKKQGYSLGMYPSVPDSSDHVLTAVARSLPSKVNLTQYTASIKDQLKCGTCVAKGTTNIMNANLQFNKSMPENGLSSLYLYTRCKQEDQMPDTEGTFPRVALHISKKEGVCEEKYLPYKKCDPLPSLTDEMKENAQQYKIKAYTRLYGTHQIKAALASGQMVAIGTIVSSDNWLEQNGWILEPKGRLMGLHLTYLDGYDDNLQYSGHQGFFFGVNSWGKDWGMNGRFRMSYDYAEWENVHGRNFTALTEAWAIDMGSSLPSKDITTIEIWIGEREILIDGTRIALPVAPEVKEGEPMIPARFIAEYFGASMESVHEGAKIIILKE